MGQDRQMQIAGGNGRNQFRQYAENLAGYNDVIGNQVIQNAVQNPRVRNVGNQNGLIGVLGNGNQNQIGNGNLVAARAEGNAAGAPVYNSDGSAKPEWSRYVTIVHQTKDLHTTDYTQLYDFLKNQVIQNAVQNPRVQNVRNQNGLIGVQGNRNQNPIGNGNLVAARAERNVAEQNRNAAGQNGNQIRCYNCRGQASTSGTQTDSAPVYDTDGSAKGKQLVEPEEEVLRLQSSKVLCYYHTELAKGK
nr:hypothetical protein [Tanacetum cinerariifolium]